MDVFDQKTKRPWTVHAEHTKKSKSINSTRVKVIEDEGYYLVASGLIYVLNERKMKPEVFCSVNKRQNDVKATWFQNGKDMG